MKKLHSAKILLIAHSGRLCSAGRLLFECARVLKSYGAELHIMFPRESPTPQVTLVYEDIGVREILEESHIQYDLAIANCQALAEFVVELRKKIISPIIFWIHECWQHRDPELMKTALSISDALIFQSVYQRDSVYRNILTESKARIFFVPNCASPVFGCGQKHSVNSQIIVTVGSMIARKRIGDFVDAVLGCGGSPTAYLVGENSKMDSIIREKILEHPKRFVMTGNLPNNETQSIIASADVFVHPSEAESQPISVLEAMQHGKAIVLADLQCYEHMHLVHQVNCLKYPLGNTLMLQHSIEKILESKQMSDRLGREAKITYQDRFSVEQFQRNISSVIEGMISVSP